MDRGVEIGAGKLTWRSPIWSFISAAGAAWPGPAVASASGAT
jgi:hypothetical protein